MQSVPDVEGDRLPPWREKGLKKRANVTHRTPSPRKTGGAPAPKSNEGEKTSTAVAARRRQWETQGVVFLTSPSRSKNKKGLCQACPIDCSAELADRREACIRDKGAEYIGGDFWNVLPAIVTEKTQGEVNPKDAEILRALGEAIKDALAGREEFDILVNDESLKPGYVERYQRVIWIGE